MSTTCKGRYKHNELAARQVAYVKTQHGTFKWVACKCKDCSSWHVEKEKTNVKR